MNSILKRILKKNNIIQKGIKDDPYLSLLYLMKKDMDKKNKEFVKLDKKNKEFVKFKNKHQN